MPKIDLAISPDFFELRAPLAEAFGAGFDWAALSERSAFIMYEAFVFSTDWIDDSRQFFGLRVLLPAGASIVDFARQDTHRIPNNDAGIRQVITAVRAYCELHVEARVRALYAG
jgi:hypothetical protein